MNIYRRLYCCTLAAIVVLPIILTAIRFCAGKSILFKEPELHGVVNIPQKPVISLHALQSGHFQAEFERYFTYKLVLRKILTRCYNQILYSIFTSTENESILVGRDQYIYEKAYPVAYLTEVPPEAIPQLTKKMEELAELRRLLHERGVALAVRMSPSKAQHYPEYLPAGYDRFITMKHSGAYGPNWHKIFMEEAHKAGIEVYDRPDLIRTMKQEGRIAFTKGGTHWSLAPMAEYINGFNAYLERLLGKKLGRMTVASESVLDGKMGVAEDSDIWDICWNALHAKPEYPSPNITFDTTPHPPPFLKIFNVGQSFSTILLRAVYSVKQPVWSETYFSWYNGRVLHYPTITGWGDPVSNTTEDFELYLSMDVIVIEFLENTANHGAAQFTFIRNMLEYLQRTRGSGK